MISLAILLGVILEVGGLAPTPVSFTADQLAKLPTATATIAARDGTATIYSGPTLATVLEAAGVPMSAKPVNVWLARYVVVIGEDGYRAVFSIGELHETYGSLPAILALEQNGEAVGVADRPMKLVLPGETKQRARWVRQVRRIMICEAP
jgi:DMSO/TMAO reductase YedYZ molybdopterin-dependent catalytic subunit